MTIKGVGYSCFNYDIPEVIYLLENSELDDCGYI